MPSPILYDSGVNGTTLYLNRYFSGLLENATSVTLSDEIASYGIMELNSRNVVVNAGAAVINTQTGMYQYTLSNTINPNSTYVASWQIVTPYGTDYVATLINPIGTLATRGQIRASAARAMNLLIAEGVTTSATTNTIVDTSGSTGGLKSNSNSIYLFDNCYCLITTGPATGNWRETAQGAYAPSTGTLTLASPWDNAALPTADGGDKYEVYAGLTPSQWSLRDNASIVDFGLERCRFMRRAPLTLVVDGDMEANGTEAWTSVNTSLVKSAIEAVTYGSQSLIVINSSANGYAQSTPIQVIPHKGYSVWADYRCLTTTLSTASLQVWDLTNDQLIRTGNDEDNGVNFEGGRSQTGFSVPKDCYQIAIRLVGDEANAAIAWDNVIVVSSGRRRYNTPNWIQNRNQIMNFLVRDGGRPFEDRWSVVGFPQDVQEDPTAVNTFVIDIPNYGNGFPLFIIGEDSYGPMSGVSDNIMTACPLEWATYTSAREAYQYYFNELEGVALQRATSARIIVETLAQEKDKVYMPIFQSSVSFPFGMAGCEITRFPGY